MMPETGLKKETSWMCNFEKERSYTAHLNVPISTISIM